MTSSIAQQTNAFSNSPTQLKQDVKSSLQKYWHYYASKGRESHLNGRLRQATDYFIESVRIGKALVLDELKDSKKNQQHGIELLYIASHNLASCYNGQNKSTQGEDILKECHDAIITISMDNSYSNTLRLEALCVLKKSLFSLSSQLAYMNKPAEIHSLINKTEQIATCLQKQLLSNMNN